MASENSKPKFDSSEDLDYYEKVNHQGMTDAEWLSTEDSIPANDPEIQKLLKIQVPENFKWNG
jgi:hypothetical protein